jgi:hypothetical protein
VPLHAKHVATERKPKPDPRVQPVSFEQADLVIKEVQTDMTAAVLSVVDDIEKRLPNREFLTTFRIICPAFWISEQDEEELEELLFSNSLDLLCDHFGKAHNIDGCAVPAIVNRAKMYDQSATCKAFARDAARMARQKCARGVSVAASTGDMLVMWRKLRTAGESRRTRWASS